jgi:hypothetical protein
LLRADCAAASGASFEGTLPQSAHLLPVPVHIPQSSIEERMRIVLGEFGRKDDGEKLTKGCGEKMKR